MQPNRFEDPGRRSADDIPASVDFTKMSDLIHKYPNELKMALRHLADAQGEFDRAKAQAQVFNIADGSSETLRSQIQENIQRISSQLESRLRALDRMGSRAHEPDPGFVELGQQMLMAYRKQLVQLGILDEESAQTIEQTVA